MTTHHSPAPWQLHPHVHEFDQFNTCFEIRASDESILGYLVYNEAAGITALEWADAGLIIAAPRLLSALRDFRHAIAKREELTQVCRETDVLLCDLAKAGVL